VVPYTAIAAAQAELGDMEAARQSMAVADARFEQQRAERDWYWWQYNLTTHIEQGHGLLLSAQGKVAEAEQRLRGAVAAAEKDIAMNVRRLRLLKNTLPQDMVVHVAAVKEWSLAATLRQQGKLAEAEAVIRSALLRHLQIYGRNTVDSALSIMQ